LAFPLYIRGVGLEIIYKTPLLTHLTSHSPSYLSEAQEKMWDLKLKNRHTGRGREWMRKRLQRENFHDLKKHEARKTGKKELSSRDKG
jgi:hypothetical protein